MGFRGYRVRYHSTPVGAMARIELPEPEDIFGVDVAELISSLKSLGFRIITLDLEGYRPSGHLLKRH